MHFVHKYSCYRTEALFRGEVRPSSEVAVAFAYILVLLAASFGVYGPGV